MASKADRQERDRFIALIGAEFGLKGIAAAQELMRIARAMNRLNEQWANGDIDEDTFDKRDTRLTQRAERIANDLGITIDTNGDPRGYPLRIHVASGAYNTWGGREYGYGVPC